MSSLCCIDDAFWGCGRRVCGFITFLLCFGPCCIIVAIAMFVVAAKDPRDHHIATYNQAVDLWAGSEYQNFANLKLAMAVYDNQDSPRLCINDTSMDSIDDSGRTIHQYSGYLKYTYTGSILPQSVSSPSQRIQVENIGSGNDASVQVKAYNAYSEGPSQLGCTHSSSTSSSSSYSPYTCAQYCYNQKGYWQMGIDRCYFIQYLKEVAVVVQSDGTFLSNPIGYQDYTSTQPDSVGASYTTSSREMPDITVTIRSVYDPYLTIYKLTHGSLWFGLTSRQYATIGIAFIAVGAAMIALVAGLFFLACWLGHCLMFNSGSGRSRF